MEDELEALRAARGARVLRENAEVAVLVPAVEVARGFVLPKGSPPNVVDVLLLLPTDYPRMPPSDFLVHPPLTLMDGRIPDGVAGEEERLGRSWQRFGWSIPATLWRPGEDTLATTILPFVERRLALPR